MLKVLGVFVLCFVLSACGGGGGSASGVDASAAIVGTYSLIGFTVHYDSGAVVTQNDVTSYSGTFVLNTNGTYSQTVTANGVSDGDFGTWSANGSSVFATSGQSGCSGIIGYTFDGSTLTTTNDHQCGGNFREVDVWFRIGPPATKPTISDVTAAQGGRGLGAVAGALTQR